MENNIFTMAIPVVTAIVALAALTYIIVSSYVKAPPDTAYILSGFRKNPRILVGQGGVKIPLLERLDHLFLGQVSVDIKTGNVSVPTRDYINVQVDAVAKVCVNKDAAGMQLACQNFLGMDTQQIARTLKDSLEGNMREIIGALSIEEITTDRDKFSDQIMEKAARDMLKLGIEVISCNIQNVTDESGLIKDMGADNTARIKKAASICKANADRDVAIAQAEAQKQANDAQVASRLEIAQKQNELAIRQAELKKASDIKNAEADAAYEIQRQEQEKTIQTATVNAEIAKTQREQELKAVQVEVRTQELNAQIQKQADAEKYAIEQRAAADLARRQREAEAKLYEQQKEADAQKAQAEAKRFAAEQDAAGIKAKGEAEAAAIQAKGEAEAAAMDKKAEAMKKYGHAAMAQMAMEVLPKVAAEIAKPLATIDKVSIIGGGSDGSAVGTMASNVPVVMAKTFQSVKEATGVDLGAIMMGESIDAKVNRKIDISGDDDQHLAQQAAVAASIVK